MHLRGGGWGGGIRLLLLAVPERREDETVSRRTEYAISGERGELIRCKSGREKKNGLIFPIIDTRSMSFAACSTALRSSA